MKKLSWFDEMNLRYLWRKFFSTVTKFSEKMYKFSDAANIATKEIKEFTDTYKNTLYR